MRVKQRRERAGRRTKSGEGGLTADPPAAAPPAAEPVHAPSPVKVVVQQAAAAAAHVEQYPWTWRRLMLFGTTLGHFAIIAYCLVSRWDSELAREAAGMAGWGIIANSLVYVTGASAQDAAMIIANVWRRRFPVPANDAAPPPAQPPAVTGAQAAG